jgi:hypothetical protein
MGAAQRLVGTLAHPLNHARPDPTGRVVAGCAATIIIRPHRDVADVTRRPWFADLRRRPRLRIYTHAVSSSGTCSAPVSAGRASTRSTASCAASWPSAETGSSARSLRGDPWTHRACQRHHAVRGIGELRCVPSGCTGGCAATGNPAVAAAIWVPTTADVRAATSSTRIDIGRSLITRTQPDQPGAPGPAGLARDVAGPARRWWTLAGFALARAAGAGDRARPSRTRPPGAVRRRRPRPQATVIADAIVRVAIRTRSRAEPLVDHAHTAVIASSRLHRALLARSRGPDPAVLRSRRCLGPTRRCGGAPFPGLWSSHRAAPG